MPLLAELPVGTQYHPLGGMFQDAVEITINLAADLLYTVLDPRIR